MGSFPHRFAPDRIQALRRHAKEAAKAFEEHFDGCRTCIESAWNNELCIDGEKLMKKSRDLHEDLEEVDGY